MLSTNALSSVARNATGSLESLTKSLSTSEYASNIPQVSVICFVVDLDGCTPPYNMRHVVDGNPVRTVVLLDVPSLHSIIVIS